MKYLMLDRSGRHELMERLRTMGDFLARRFAGLTEDEATAPGPGGTFSPVEQCWHLADLEREGFGERIRRLLAEDQPLLPDFDGARVAQERQYRSLSLAAGLEAFRAARAGNLAALRALEPEQWLRAGEQEGVGAVALCDLPHMMAEHDASHRSEIEGS